MSRRELAGVLAAVTAIPCVSWLIDRFAWFSWILLVAALIVVVVGSLVGIARSARREVSDSPYLPRARGSHLPSGVPGPYDAPLTRHRRPRSCGGTRPGPSFSKDMWR